MDHEFSVSRNRIPSLTVREKASIRLNALALPLILAPRSRLFPFSELCVGTDHSAEATASSKCQRLTANAATASQLTGRLATGINFERSSLEANSIRTSEKFPRTLTVATRPGKPRVMHQFPLRKSALARRDTRRHQS